MWHRCANIYIFVYYKAMIIYTLFIFLLCFFTFYHVKTLRIDGINKWVIPFGFSFKVLAGFIFIYIYSEIYGGGNLSGDAGDFMFESKILYNVFYQSPLDYFKFLFGFDDLSLSSKYLSETHHWGAGKQSIINDNRNILRVHSIFHFFSFGIASIHMIIICFLSTIGLIQLVKGIKQLTVLNPLYIFLLFLFLPSLLFWGSGLLKEPFMILGVGLFFRGLLYNEKIVKKIFLLVVGLVLLLGFKPYILLCLIPSISFYVLYKVIPKFKLIGPLLILSVTLFIFSFAFPVKRNFIIQLLSRKQYDFNNIGRGGVFLQHGINFYYLLPDQFNQLLIAQTIDGELSELTPEKMAQVNEGKFIVLKDTLKATIINHGGFGEPKDTIMYPDNVRRTISYINYRSEGLIDVTLINNSGLQLTLNSFEAIVNSLFRPFPLDPGGKLIYQSMLEVWGIYLLLIFAFLNRKKLAQKEKALIIAIILFIISLALLIGWVTPVLGAIVRYRFPALMGILIISLIVIKVPKRLSKIASN